MNDVRITADDMAIFDAALADLGKLVMLTKKQDAEIKQLETKLEQQLNVNGELQVDIMKLGNRTKLADAFFEAGGTDGDCWTALVCQRDEAREAARYCFSDRTNSDMLCREYATDRWPWLEDK